MSEIKTLLQVVNRQAHDDVTDAEYERLLALYSSLYTMARDHLGYHTYELPTWDP